MDVVNAQPAPLKTSAPNSGLIFFQKSFYKKASATFFVTWLAVQVINFNHPLPILWLIMGSISEVCFFYYFYKISKSWTRYPDEVFRKKLYKKALIIRIVFIVFLYFFFIIVYGQPFEAGAADAYFYDNSAQDVSYYILYGLNVFEKLKFLDTSDTGFPIYLGIVYSVVFNSVLLGRICNAFLGAWSCIFIYDLAKRNFNEQVARLAGIMVMLLPNLIYYSGLTLKETLMVFLVIVFINKGDALLRAKRTKFKEVLLLTAVGGSLFLFRTVLALSLILSLLTTVVLISPRVSNRGRRLFLGIWIGLAVLAIFSSSLGDEISSLISGRENNQESQMQNFSTRQNGNTLAKYGSMSVFLPMILVAPFPTLVDTGQNNQMMLCGAMFTRNVYAFFVFIALFVMYRRKTFNKHALILSFVAIYLLVLASSGFALSERFHLPVLPFLAILTAYGITQMNNKRKGNYVPYLVFIALVIIGWNWFKLAGRGM